MVPWPPPEALSCPPWHGPTTRARRVPPRAVRAVRCQPGAHTNYGITESGQWALNATVGVYGYDPLEGHNGCLHMNKRLLVPRRGVFC